MRPLQYLGKESHQEPRENYPTYPMILQHRLHDQSLKEQNKIRNVSESTEHGDATARKVRYPNSSEYQAGHHFRRRKQEYEMGTPWL